jgi:hypothetical protein
MKNLYQRLKPEVKRALESNEPKYSGSVKQIIFKLEGAKFYSDLTIGDIRSLYIFADIDISKVSLFDFRWGDNILMQDDE